jgi:hypothetical protein
VTDGDDRLDALIQRADLDGLVRLVDECTATADWRLLRQVRDRSRAAVVTGRQLWPAATLAEYRLALIAPPDWAAPMIGEDAGLFTIGPLTEVIAQHHTWAQLQPLLPATPGAAVVAHERALRGERIDKATVAGLPDVFELPYELAAWEPAYPLATYSDDGLDEPTPTAARTDPVRRRAVASVVRVDDDETELAFRQLVEAWTASSNGRAEMTCVEGGADEAVAAFGVPAWTAQDVALGDAISWLAWAGASGGAHGRRRGAALGRFGALWLLAALLDLGDEWPVPLEGLGAEGASLRWAWWDAGEPQHGWRLQLAVEDPDSGHAWAFSAVDAT